MSEPSEVSADRVRTLRDTIAASYFSPESNDTNETNSPAAIGAEVELHVIDVATGRPLALDGPRGAIARVAAYGRTLGWAQRRAYDGTVRFNAGGKATLSFEPGGQLEVSSRPERSFGALAALLERVVAPLAATLASDGIQLRSIGIDPDREAHEIPLQLVIERYRRMTEYFESIGPFGVRMMRQTAAMQLSVDRGARPVERWHLLEDIAPYAIAMFANSRRHAGADTGHESYRAHCWRRLDPTRTGIVHTETVATRDAHGDESVASSLVAASAYVQFALGANDMFRRDDSGAYRPYREWGDADWSDERWARHLTTLFPEVRPRGHFELRSPDAIPPEWYAAQIVFVYGLVYDARSAADAATLAGESRSQLVTAGRDGLRDPAIARTARELATLALRGAARRALSRDDWRAIDTARAFFERFTWRDRSPSDESAPDRRAAVTTAPV